MIPPVPSAAQDYNVPRLDEIFHVVQDLALQLTSWFGEYFLLDDCFSLVPQKTPRSFFSHVLGGSLAWSLPTVSNMSMACQLPSTIFGNCHCGGYRFRVDEVDWTAVSVCDCALCTKQGYLWLHLPRADNTFTVTRDDGNLREYATDKLRQKFCSVCGTGITCEHATGALSDVPGFINLRTLCGVNPFDFDPRPPAVTTTAISPGSADILPSQGSCHCGRVTVQFLTSPGKFELKEDNCSICARNAWIGVYPPKDEVILKGAEHMQEYQFGRKFNGSPFCRTCGVHVCQNLYGPSQQIIDRLPEERRAQVLKMLDIKPINVRILDGIDLQKLDVKRTDEGTEGYEETVLK